MCRDTISWFELEVLSGRWTLQAAGGTHTYHKPLSCVQPSRLCAALSVLSLRPGAEALRALACRQQACRPEAGLPCEMLPVPASRGRTTLWRPSGRWTLQAAGTQTWSWCAASWASFQALGRYSSVMTAELAQDMAGLLHSRGSSHGSSAAPRWCLCAVNSWSATAVASVFCHQWPCTAVTHEILAAVQQGGSLPSLPATCLCIGICSSSACG